MTRRALLALGLWACEPRTDVPVDTDAWEDTEPAEATDPLSMPAEPTLDLATCSPAPTCATCHPVHAEQWAHSNHAYAMVDPVFRALVDLRQAERGGREDRFCTQCHSALGVRSGDVAPGFSWDALDPVTLEGVTCEACHAVTEVVRPYNSGHVLEPGSAMRGGIVDPVPTGAHASVTTDLLATPAFCAGCHDVRELGGLPLERPYEEYLSSPAHPDGPTCVDCHMDRWDGRAAVGGPECTGLHDHGFRGVDIPLLEGFADEATRARIAAGVEDLLGRAATIEVLVPPEVPAGQTADVLVTVENLIEGHHLPTGTTFLRQLWIELVAEDAVGHVHYATGQLDTRGDLMDWWSDTSPLADPDLVTLHSTLLDAEGEPTFLTWEATEQHANALPARHARTYTYFVPTDPSAAGPVTVRARLRFRQVGPYVLRAVGMEDAVDDLVIWDLATDAQSFDVTGPAR